jgi:hypothetical protein
MARIYQTYIQGDAQVRVALVNDPGAADLWVYRVSSWGLAQGDALWYITTERDQASVRVYFDSIGMAQLKICFVSTRGMAGWQKAHRLQNHFR